VAAMVRKLKMCKMKNEHQFYHRILPAVYLFGERIITIAFSKSLGEDQFTLVEDRNTHAWDTAIGTGLLQDCWKIVQKFLVVFVSIRSVRNDDSHCVFFCF
jgi:hypothetical protein